MAVSRREAVQAALRVLDEAGLEGMSLRRVAAELGVAAPTLYWHVRDKRELLDLVAEAILAEQVPMTEPRPGQAWWDWLEERSLAQYRALLTVRDSARLVAGNRPTPESYGPIDRMLGSLAAAGIPPVEGLRMLMVLGAYTIGSVLERQAEQARAEEGGTPEAPPDWDPERYPHLAAAAAGIRAGVLGGDPRDTEAVFIHGLGLLLDAMRARQLDRAGVRPAD